MPGAAGERTQVIQTFGTTTPDLLVLRDWLTAHRVTHVAMESTGVYWKPVYYVLEDAFSLLLVNAAHMANVPGRKTDVADCAWIAQLLECGLLRGSFVPPPPTRELRDLTRYCKALIQDRTREANRLHKVLEDAGIKLATWPATSWASRGAPCCPLSSPGPPMPRCWPTSPAGSSGRSCRPCARP